MIFLYVLLIWNTWALCGMSQNFICLSIIISEKRKKYTRGICINITYIHTVYTVYTYVYIACMYVFMEMIHE